MADDRPAPHPYVVPAHLPDFPDTAPHEQLHALMAISEQLDHLAKLLTQRPPAAAPAEFDTAAFYTWAVKQVYADAVTGTSHAIIVERAESLTSKAYATWLECTKGVTP